MSIEVGELVQYKSKYGSEVVAKVVKVNRVNSKIQVCMLDDLLYPGKLRTIPKIRLRRATTEQKEQYLIQLLKG